MTDLRTAAKQVPLRELLASVPPDARLVIDDADGKGTRFIPVGRLCQEAAAALAEPQTTHSADCYKWHHECAVAEVQRLRAALAEPVQEPVAWIPKWAHDRLTGQLGAIADPVKWGVDAPLYVRPTNDTVPIYTAPPQRTPLTDEHMQALAEADRIMGHDDAETEWRERWGHLFPGGAEPVQAESISDAMMNLVDRLGSEFDQVDPRAWEHLLVYAPRAKPLTDEEIIQIELSLRKYYDNDTYDLSLHDFARAIERAHGIGEPLANHAKTSGSPLVTPRGSLGEEA